MPAQSVTRPKRFKLNKSNPEARCYLICYSYTAPGFRVPHPGDTIESVTITILPGRGRPSRLPSGNFSKNAHATKTLEGFARIMVAPQKTRSDGDDGAKL